MIEFLANLKPWQNVCLSLGVGLTVWIVLIVASIMFLKWMENRPENSPITEEELRHKRERAAYLAATKPDQPKLKGIQE